MLDGQYKPIGGSLADLFRTFVAYILAVFIMLTEIAIVVGLFLFFLAVAASIVTAPFAFLWWLWAKVFH